MRSTHPLALFAGVCALGALSGCDVTIRDGDVSFGRLHGKATQEWKRQYPLEPGGRVEIVNGNGSIEVAVGANDSVGVAALLSARSMTDERATKLLESSKIDEQVTPAHIRLATVRGGESGGFNVTYKVSVPLGARVEMTGTNGILKADGLRGHVKAMVANGDIELTGLRGSVDAASVNGTISVKMAEVTDRVRLESTNGRVALEIPRDTKATLNARSVNGGLRVTGLTASEATGRRIRNLESVLNGGGPEIEVRVTNGRATIEGR